MAALLGTSIGVFVGLTVILIGGCAVLMGQAIAHTWRPAWQVVAYGLLLGAVDRFLTHALFRGDLWSLSGYLIDTATLLALALLGYRATRVHRMVRQYPWLYERTGLLSYRGKAGG